MYYFGFTRCFSNLQQMANLFYPFVVSMYVSLGTVAITSWCLTTWEKCLSPRVCLCKNAHTSVDLAHGLLVFLALCFSVLLRPQVTAVPAQLQPAHPDVLTSPQFSPQVMISRTSLFPTSATSSLGGQDLSMQKFIGLFVGRTKRLRLLCLFLFFDLQNKFLLFYKKLVLFSVQNTACKTLIFLPFCWDQVCYLYYKQEARNCFLLASFLPSINLTFPTQVLLRWLSFLILRILYSEA